VKAKVTKDTVVTKKADFIPMVNNNSGSGVGNAGGFVSANGIDGRGISSWIIAASGIN